MKTCISTFLIGLFLTQTFPSQHINELGIPTPAISIRHDTEDSLYIELGNKFPAVCRVGHRGGDGTLIAPRWVITAAHVAQGIFRREGNGLKIYFRNEDLGFAVKRVFLHPDFIPMQGSDIALIELEKPNNTIRPLHLYSQRIEEGKEIIIVGHGDQKTGLGGEWIVDGIKRGATNTIDEVTKDKIVFDFDEPPSGTILEGTAGRGDSGGPAIIMEDDLDYIAGISSAGMPGKNGPGTYGAVEYYTRVSTHLPWLANTMENPRHEHALLDRSNTDSDGIRSRSSVQSASTIVPGLGLMLMQENARIRIGGKADSMVPEAFRYVMFRPPSFIESLNERSYSSLQDFRKDFDKIDSGDDFSIQFKIQGVLKTFNGKKL